MNNTSTDKVAFVIAHYHKEGHLDKHMLDHVKYISKLTKKIIFVSTHLSEEWRLVLEPYAHVIVRPNYGYDFWSYRLGIEALGDLRGLDHLFFWNSSFVCIAPARLYENYAAKIGDSGMYGITGCKIPYPHIQSYFFSFYGENLIQSEDFRNWWSYMTPVNDRQEVIERYEVGMSQYFLRRRVPLAHAFDISFSHYVLILVKIILSLNFKKKILRSLRKKFRFPKPGFLNLTHYAPRRLLNKFGVIKIELLTRNPTRQNISSLLDSLNKDEMAYITEIAERKSQVIWDSDALIS